MHTRNFNLTFPICDALFGTSDLNKGLFGTLFNGMSDDARKEEDQGQARAQQVARDTAAKGSKRCNEHNDRSNLQRLESRVAIVTGAAQGIGARYAQALAAEGAAVVCADVSRRRAGRVGHRCSRRPGARGRTDVTSPESVRAMAAASVGGFWTDRRAGQQRRPVHEPRAQAVRGNQQRGMGPSDGGQRARTFRMRQSGDARDAASAATARSSTSPPAPYLRACRCYCTM